MADLYREAMVEGSKQWWNQCLHDEPMPVWEGVLEETLGPEIPEYWIARYAARKAADAVLEAAKAVGVTPEQWEAMRKVAADVAYD